MVRICIWRYLKLLFLFSLTTNAETAEIRCEELNRQIDEITRQFRSEKRRNDKIIQEQSKQDEIKRTELLKPKLNASLPCDVGSYNVSFLLCSFDHKRNGCFTISMLFFLFYLYSLCLTNPIPKIYSRSGLLTVRA